MSKKIKYIILFLLIPLPCLAASSGNVIINEIAWMGISGNSYAEWIELYNNTEEEIDLTDWKITTARGLVIILEDNKKISPSGYFLLLKNTTGDTPNTEPDQIYKGKSLSDEEGEKIDLIDNNEYLIDSVDCSNGWFAGSAADDQTMERKNPQEDGNNKENWQNSQTVDGTPKAANISEETTTPEIIEEETIVVKKIVIVEEPVIIHKANHPPTAEAGPDIVALTNQEITFDGSQSSDPDNDNLEYFWNFGDGSTDTNAISLHSYTIPGQYIATLKVNDEYFTDLDSILVNIYDNSVIISEFLPNPEGSDEENEWIELYNQSDQIANLSGWQLSDSAKTFTFPENTLIAPRQFLVFKRPITKISLNNDGDEVKLIFPNGETASQVSYAKGKGSVAFKNEYLWTAVPTPGMSNIISNEEIKMPEPIAQTTEVPEKITINLTKTEDFSVKELPEEPLNIQSQNILGRVQTLNKEVPSNNPIIILVISILVSGFLLIIWGLRFFH